MASGAEVLDEEPADSDGIMAAARATAARESHSTGWRRRCGSAAITRWDSLSTVDMPTTISTPDEEPEYDSRPAIEHLSSAQKYRSSRADSNAYAYAGEGSS